MAIGWVTAFLDVVASQQDVVERFWTATTGTHLSPRRGPDAEFVTFVPGDGDPYLRLQRVRSGPGGVHLDLHTDDPDALVARAVQLGASPGRAHPGKPRLGLVSPGGFRWCAVHTDGHGSVPRPNASPEGVRVRLDQFAIDVPANLWDAEVAFWVAVTGWEAVPSAAHEEFLFLSSPTGGMPMRFLLQRLQGRGGLVHGHLDFAAGGDLDALASWHESLGAVRRGRFASWQVMQDPSGRTYCLTGRDPV